MPHWYEVFDNEEVQRLSRKRAAALIALAMTLVAVTLTLLAMSREGVVPTAPAGVLITSSWLGTAWWITRRLRRLRRLVWCVKLSENRIVGYDYTRSKTTLDWRQVERLELTQDGLVVVGPDECSLEIPHLFPEYAILSHRIVRYADAHGIPIFVNGRPWEDLDVYALFPFLEAGSSTKGPTPV
ncbi:hypothetical protein [Rhodocaloribacter sp.]